MDSITVLIATSPIPSHPDTRIIEETINSVRTHLPKAEIVLMIDGVREEQQDRMADYQEYIRRLLWISNKQRCYPLIFDEHQHQANMTREALKHVHTPLILFVEQDTPLAPDREIEWEPLTQAILKGDANIIRFHHEALVLEVHEYLMLGEVENLYGAKLRRTYQYSQRPHLASTVFYKQMIDKYFTKDSRTFIEDRMYGIIEQEVRENGIMGWNLWRLWMYHPDGDIKRSYHTDGRAGDQKFDDRLVF